MAELNTEQFKQELSYGIGLHLTSQLMKTGAIGLVDYEQIKASLLAKYRPMEAGERVIHREQRRSIKKQPNMLLKPLDSSMEQSEDV